uniref:Uncharacterized protein n=1 Tax=Anguilla anguilla TaxID=7936 RepID=A0A0E9SVR1_ANGAN
MSCTHICSIYPLVVFTAFNN